MIVLISEDLMMSSTVSSAVRSAGGTFRFVASTDRARVKLEGNTCELLLVDLQTPQIDWADLESLILSVPAAIAFAQHVYTELLERASRMTFQSVLTRGQLHANVAQIVAEHLPG